MDWEYRKMLEEQRRWDKYGEITAACIIAFAKLTFYGAIFVAIILLIRHLW